MDVASAVVELLCAAQVAEASAHGSSRRDAFSTTRHLLAGCRAVGIPLENLADLLHVRPDSIRIRASMDGLVPAATFAALSGIGLDDITAWQRNGRIPPRPRTRCSAPATQRPP